MSRPAPGAAASKWWGCGSRLRWDASATHPAGLRPCPVHVLDGGLEAAGMRFAGEIDASATRPAGLRPCPVHVLDGGLEDAGMRFAGEIDAPATRPAGLRPFPVQRPARRPRDGGDADRGGGGTPRRPTR